MKYYLFFFFFFKKKEIKKRIIILFGSGPIGGLKRSMSPGPFCNIHHCIYFKCFKGNNIKNYKKEKEKLQTNFPWS